MKRINEFQLTTIVTEQCNLKCKYCYVACREVPTIAMSDDVVDALLAFSKNKLTEGYDRIRLDIFGGEPLLYPEKVKYIITKFKELYDKDSGSILITIFTNGTLLTQDMLDFTLQYRYVNYNFSVDGDRDCHNTNRVYIDGSGSYDDVMRGVHLFAKAYHMNPKEVSLMFMISPNNIRNHFNTVKALYDSGMKRYYSGIIRDDTWTEDDIKAYKAVMEQTVDFVIEHINEGFINTYFFYPHTDHENKRCTFCGACKSQVGVSPDGSFYPCQRFFNNRSGFKIGDVWNGIDENNSVYQAMHNFSTHRSSCSKCKYGLYPGCMGQCFAALYEATGNIFKNIDCICQLNKINYDLSERMYNTLKDNAVYMKILNSGLGGG